jgi:hypothetical protein
MEKITGCGTWLQGHVRTSYNELREVFGEPHYRHGDKTTVEWAFEHNGEKFTIYDWKCPSSQSHLQETFNIGGENLEAVNIVVAMLRGEKV